MWVPTLIVLLNLSKSIRKFRPVTKQPGGPVDKPVGEIAGKLGVSMDQVLLAWAKAKGSVPVT